MTVVASSSVSCADVELCDDGNVYVTVRPLVKMSRTDIKEALAAHLELSAGKRHAVLIDFRAIRGISLAAINELRQSEVIDLLVRCAMVVESPVTGSVARFLIAIVKPKYPTRVFRSMAMAQRWLLTGSESAIA